MIFLSHNSNDKPIVEQIAVKLSEVYGQDNVFYDSWSIQPGDGIIDKMNEGLAKCKFFFYFISQNSLTSSMVKMEWQNALFKAAQNAIRFIPVRLDRSAMPPIMLQTLYIDLYTNGLEVALRQMIDVINGNNTFKQVNPTFSNLVAYKYHNDNRLIVECRALHYLEPISRFSFMTFDDIDKIAYLVQGESVHTGGRQKQVPIAPMVYANAITIGINRGTLPGFPVVVEFSSKELTSIDVVSVFHQVSSEQFAKILLISGRP